MRQINAIAVAIFLVVVLVLFAFTPRNTQIMQARFLGLIAPLLKNGSSIQKQVIGLREGMKKLTELDTENKQLRVELNELRAKDQTLQGLEAENNQLRRALQFRERSQFRLVPARIIARDASTWWSTINVDKGSNDGVEPDQPVLTEDGLVGKTTIVSANACTILLISDENCGIAATVEGTRERGVVRGTRTSTQATPDLTLGLLSKMANLKPGMKVFSSGLGGVFPTGVLIGEVKNFEVLPLEGQATVVPAVDLSTIEDVFIVTGGTK
ncbi:MAG TPA: rod shape-determining protein MreC [Chthoniobacteraceae bacterium]|jgi:rod shape-determining protein MreC|nr:rod shape-determining protein MreC [Chthoniobacteraceae bacterium]